MNKQAITDKFSYIFQENVCKLVEANNYAEICSIIKTKYKNDAETILTGIGAMLNNSYNLIPQLIRYGSGAFTREKS